MKKLTLQITGDCFRDILEGRQKTENRLIYPSTASRYLVVHDLPDGTCDVEIIRYDALRLINGRHKESPRMLVEVVGAQLVTYLDDNGEVGKATDRHGTEYYTYGIEYQLGKVISAENTENLRQSQEKQLPLHPDMERQSFTKAEIDDFRQKFYEALLAVKSNGKPFLTKEQAKEIVDGYSDKILAQDMRFNTPESLADIWTM